MKSPAGMVHVDELPPQVREKVMSQVAPPADTAPISDVVSPIGKNDDREMRLLQLHQSAIRDSLAIGKLLIEMRGEHPRGEWTAYLDGVAARTGISRRTLFRYIAHVEKPPKEKVAPPDFRTATSPDGHPMDVLQSWLQKAIRRGEERQALYAAAQFSKTGFDGAVWNTLVTVASEDIGLAATGLVAEILALQDAYKIEKARKSEHNPQRLQLTHAVLLCVRAKKSRLVDHATIVTFESDEKFTPPDWVFDKHTRQGRAAGKNTADFFNDGAKLSNEATGITDSYKNEARKLRSRNEAAWEGTETETKLSPVSASPDPVALTTLSMVEN